MTVLPQMRKMEQIPLLQKDLGWIHLCSQSHIQWDLECQSWKSL